MEEFRSSHHCTDSSLNSILIILLERVFHIVSYEVMISPHTKWPNSLTTTSSYAKQKDYSFGQLPSLFGLTHACENQ